jgi:hypothetical protein
MIGPFCAQCGQRDVPPYPSVRELAVDAFWELSGWDGRFATTIRTLVRRPGMLTREFLEGRRARYISPLRLYLMASLLYFVVAAAAPDITLDGKRAVFFGVRTPPVGVQTQTGSRPQQVANATGNALENQQELTGPVRDSILAQIDAAPSLMKPFLRRAVLDPAGFRRDLLEAMPRMLFALLPVFALIIAAFYRGRKYPAHLYFAIHLHAFVFLALAVAATARFTRLAPLSITVGILALVSVPIYATFAFRRTYGDSFVRTVAKEVGIGAIYAAIAFAAFVVTLYLVSRFG